eukprot:g34657.t1
MRSSLFYHLVGSFITCHRSGLAEKTSLIGRAADEPLLVVDVEIPTRWYILCTCHPHLFYEVLLNMEENWSVGQGSMLCWACLEMGLGLGLGLGLMLDISRDSDGDASDIVSGVDKTIFAFVISAAQEKFQEQHQPFYVVFTDLAKAFDSVSKEMQRLA